MQDETRPLCECHGKPTTKNGVRYGKQEWKCADKKAAHDRRYQATEKGRSMYAASGRRYNATAKGMVRHLKSQSRKAKQARENNE